MGRWKPDARGRLAHAAFELFAEQGYERTTAAQIARRAELTESTFFRTFGSKADVLFAGFEPARERMAEAVAAAPADASMADAVGAALDALTDGFRESKVAALQRLDITAASAELRERDPSRHAELAAGLADALVARGADPAEARLASEGAMVAFRVAVTDWHATRGELDLGVRTREMLGRLRAVLE